MSCASSGRQRTASRRRAYLTRPLTIMRGRRYARRPIDRSAFGESEARRREESVAPDRTASSGGCGKSSPVRIRHSGATERAPGRPTAVTSQPARWKASACRRTRGSSAIADNAKMQIAGFSCDIGVSTVGTRVRSRDSFGTAGGHTGRRKPPAPPSRFVCHMFERHAL
jgi:hypothetical protein